MTDPAGERAKESAEYPAAPTEATSSPTIPAQVTQSMQWPAAPPVPQPAMPQPPVPQPPMPQPAMPQLAMAQHQPVPAPYGSGGPIAGPATGMPARQRRRGGRHTSTVVLAILSAVLLVGVGLMTTLLIIQKRETDRLSAQVTQLTGETTARQGKIDTLQRDLDDTRRDLTDARNEVDEIDTQRQALVDCLNASIDAAREATVSGENSAAYKAKATKAGQLCVAAFKYL